MKHLFLLAAAATALVSAPATAATTFKVDSANSSVVATNGPSLCFGCNVSATLASFQTFNLDVNQSKTFDFATYSVSGIGAASASVSAVLAFTDPFATSANNGAAVNYVTFGGLLTGGALTWNTGVQTLTGSNGTQFSVRFNNLAGLTGNSATSTVTVRLLAAAVPEPATWAMMLVGFGMVAGAARYRRRSTTATYA